MRSMLKTIPFLTLLFCYSGCSESPWISLFDGKTLTGWSASENKQSWQIENGAIVTSGDRSHLFYNGTVEKHNFKNFELSVNVKTTPGSNSGIYIHTEYQESGWPAKGYEAQVLNSNPPHKTDEYVENKMTGSIYAVRNTWKSPAADNEWFNYRILVQGKTIQSFINGQLICEYTESEIPYRSDGQKGRLLTSGTIALQCHDPGSKVFYKDIRIKILAEDTKTPGLAEQDSAFDALITQLAADNFPLMDLHTHLKGGLTMDDVVSQARSYGFTRGIVYNAGLKMGIETEDSLKTFISAFTKPVQAYIGLQAEGREWLDIFSSETVAKFDYVISDALTWTNKKGHRQRLWLKDETEIGNMDNFMDEYVANIVQILKSEPIHIFVNATFLPEEISAEYNNVWNNERTDKVIRALVENGIALEINSRYQIPGAQFIKKAKDAGVKFTFGSNNTSREDLDRLGYCLKIIKECNLTADDMWQPKNIH